MAIVILGASAWYLRLPPNQPLKIGTFFYLWYGAPDSADWNASKFVDYPVSLLLCNYSSINATIINEQLKLIRNAAIDFVVLSWWGRGENDSYENYVDSAAKQVFDAATIGEFGSLKFAIMVEPYNNGGSTYDYKGIFNRVYSDFVQPYPQIYYKHDGNPLICFFENPTLTPNGKVPYKDNKFTTITVGSNSADWSYTDLTNNGTLPNREAHEGEISVTHRFDDTRIAERNSHVIADPNLTQGAYDFEWQSAIQLRKNKVVDTIMITSWNEYPERTAIEPHIDTTLHCFDAYFLYNQTKNYITQAKLVG